MKRLLLLIIASSLYLPVSPQITEKIIPVQPQQPKENNPAELSIIDIPNKIKIYDSTHNLKYHESIFDYTMYKGQKLFFYKRADDKYSDDLLYQTFLLIQPDTIWLSTAPDSQKKKNKFFLKTPQNIKPNYILTNAYMGTYDSISGRYKTPAEAIEGKYFEIKDINIKDNNLNITLYSDETKKSFNWVIYSSMLKLLPIPAIIVGYFEKLKSTYLNKEFVFSTESINNKYRITTDINNPNHRIIFQTPNNIEMIPDLSWKCIDVCTVNTQSDYKIPYVVLENNRKEQCLAEILPHPHLKTWVYGVALGKCEYTTNAYISDFKDSKTYANQMRMQAEQMEQARKQKLLAEEQARKEAEQKRAEHKKKCIEKFGQDLGPIIAEGKVRIGMNKEMCRWAWGSPRDINKTITATKVSEQWVYSSGNYLYFTNGILDAIQN